MPLDKSGRVHVVGSVPLLHLEAQTVDEMLEGWRNQQMCRNLGHDTIAGRIRLICWPDGLLTQLTTSVLRRRWTRS